MILDFHTHCFPDALAEKAMTSLIAGCDQSFLTFHNGTVSGLLREMDRCGIDQAVIANIATKPGQVSKINDWAISVKSDRLLPLGAIHPLTPVTEIKSELAKLADHGITGIKLHPQYQGFSVNDSRMFPLYAVIAEHRFFVLFHAGYDIAFPDDESAAPEKFAEIIPAFPGLTMVLAHCGSWRAWDRVVKNIPAADNVFLETSFSLDEITTDLLSLYLTRFNIHNFIFGTDSPWRDQAREMDLIIQSFPRDAREDVLYGNAARLLNHFKYAL